MHTCMHIQKNEPPSNSSRGGWRPAQSTYIRVAHTFLTLNSVTVSGFDDIGKASANSVTSTSDLNYIIVCACRIEIVCKNSDNYFKRICVNCVYQVFCCVHVIQLRLYYSAVLSEFTKN